MSEFTDCCDRTECACAALDWADICEAEEPTPPVRGRMLNRTLGRWCPCGDCGAQPSTGQLRARLKHAWSLR